MIIKKLSSLDAQKIAAGEIIERPVNIIKEILENSIDANAKTISISVKNGGKDFILICDDGSGMILDDLKICFKRHTTSKISNFDDLNQIATFGFRGEALASICSVSRVKITSKHKNESYSNSIEIEDEKIISEYASGLSIGTEIEIKDLFYNIPARKKFLKTTETEWNQVLNLFKSIALSHTNIHFKLFHNDNLIFNLPKSASLTERIHQLFDEKMHDNLIEISHKENEIELEGIITKSTYQRYDRNHFYIFVNNRWIKNYKLTNAITKGYGNLLSFGKFPAAFLKIKINNDLVDININPKKEDVAFLNPKKIENLITELVAKHLELKLNIFENNFYPNNTQINNKNYDAFYKKPSYESFYFKLQKPLKNNYEQKIINEIEKSEIINYIFLGQFLNTYLLFEQDNELLIVDQHAAHERILYEKISQNFNGQSISLLFCEMINLTIDEIETLEKYLSLFEQNGIILEKFSKTQYAVKSLPIYAKQISITDLIKEIISDHKNEFLVDLHEKITDKIRSQIACKAAVKAGDYLSKEKSIEIIKDLLNCNQNKSCPHGRPTTWTISKNEFEKTFKRKL